jgi:glycosyltransferase involved in cell wall biosynthesis
MPILLTTPDLECAGGVAEYWRVMQPHLGSDVAYLTVGPRAPGAGARPCGRRMLQDYRSLYRALRSGPWELVHLNPSLCRRALIRDGVSLLLAKSLGRRVLVFLHGWDPACAAAIRRRFLPLFRQGYFRADAFIVLSSGFRSVLREFGYDKPIYVETTAVADELFDPPAVGRAPDGTPAEPVNILYLSRLERAKGVYEAIDAFRLLRTRRPGVTLTVAGTGSQGQAARAYVGAQGIDGVQFAGWVTGPEKRQAFARADIYLFPTAWNEGMPISVLEAMACGLPVVTRPVGGLADFFEPGTMGFLTDSRDPEVFASLLERLVLDPGLRHAMGRYNRSFAQKNFAASVVAGRLREIYRRTLV